MSKPALADLIKKTKSKRKKKAHATTSARVKPPPPPPPQTLPGSAPALSAKTVDLRHTVVETFVTEYIKNGFKAGPAYQAARPHSTIKASSAAASAYQLLGRDDVQVELQRQLKPIVVDRKLDQQWVLEQWMAMAEANLLDYVDFDAEGRPTGFNINPARLTLAQKQNIQELRIDSNTGKVTHVGIVRRTDVVVQIARANKMYSEIDNEDLSALAKEITDRMQRASKMLPHQPRTFDGKTGEEIK